MALKLVGRRLNLVLADFSSMSLGFRNKICRPRRSTRRQDFEKVFNFWINVVFGSRHRKILLVTVATFAKPENALKRAEELINVEQKQAALQALHDHITSKRHRAWQKALERIMFKEAEQARIQAQALEEALDVEDLEVDKRPEDLMLSYVCAEKGKNRSDWEIVTPWLKFLWETYRTVLEILRNNSKLESPYALLTCMSNGTVFSSVTKSLLHLSFVAFDMLHSPFFSRGGKTKERRDREKRELEEKERLRREGLLRRPVEPLSRSTDPASGTHPFKPPMPAAPAAAKAAPSLGKYMPRFLRERNEGQLAMHPESDRWWKQDDRPPQTIFYVLILPQWIIMGTKRFSLSQGILIGNDSSSIGSPKDTEWLNRIKRPPLRIQLTHLPSANVVVLESMIMIILVTNNIEGTYKTTFPIEANTAISFSQMRRGFGSQANPTAISSLGIQASSSQAYPATGSGHGDQAVPTRANVAACSSLLFQSLPVQTNPTPCTIYGAQSSLVEAGSTVNSSYGIQSALAPANPTPYIGYRPKATPAHAHPNANSANHSQLIPAQSNSAAASSHAPNDLLGQAVCGTLDGTFDAGYMLTVRVANGGHVLKGLVFDPRLCVPISVENDIAPLLPMATPNGTPSSVVESDQTLVSVPIHPVPVPFSVALPLQVREPAAASQTMNPMLVTSSLPQPSRQLNTNKVVPNDLDPQLSLNKVAPNDTDPRLSTNKVAPTDIDDLLAEVQAKTLQTLSKSSVNNANQESSPAASQHVVDDDKQAENLSADVKEEAFQTFQTTLDVLPEDRCTNLVGFLSREQSMHQVKGSSSNIVEASGANKGMRLTEESSGNVVEAAGGEQGQHCLEESWQGNMQRLSDETSDEKALLLGEPKSGVLNPEAPSCAPRINFIGED
ncbi:hypothetical protein C4D60_Mb08t06610 [Musa balbisiana]|uniref:eIF3a PCI domain-containing protein n=1 Tax=Musa balbisiana TaxID=52838 RepID=A0A4S8K1W2_MUSBA|nr:hypothetical protein C4D60_Mb08t06610 [Musa balbisiana]